MSLTVKDINVSEAFYRNLGFDVFHGDKEQGWLIMKNGETNIGLFQNMFENNILTFNPGWDQNAQEVDEFTDIREIQSKLKQQGVELQSETEEQGSGPAHIVFTDPDGNQIMIDQHR